MRLSTITTVTGAVGAALDFITGSPRAALAWAVLAVAGLLASLRGRS